MQEVIDYLYEKHHMLAGMAPSFLRWDPSFYGSVFYPKSSNIDEMRELVSQRAFPGSDEFFTALCIGIFFSFLRVFAAVLLKVF